LKKRVLGSNGAIDIRHSPQKSQRGQSVPEEGWMVATVGSASSPPYLRQGGRSISNRGKTVGGNIEDGTEDALL